MPETDTTTDQLSSAEGKILDTLDTILRSVTSPEIVEAQTILLRRLALQGDIVSSRIPAPRNITEIGGYLNLLATLKQYEMRSQMLAGILGVAGPNPPLGWYGSRPLLTMVALPNDRPEGPGQPAIPLTYAIRSDFLEGMRAALRDLHDRGCALPCMAPVRRLPVALPGAQFPEDPLSFLGRVVDIVPSSALRDPASDPIALARKNGSSDPFQVVARVIGSSPAVPTPPADWEVLTCDASSRTSVTAAGARFVPVAPILAAAGFYPASPLPLPESENSTGWARFTNRTGLVSGQSRLGDELALIYPAAEIAASTFTTGLNRVWNGTVFTEK